MPFSALRLFIIASQGLFNLLSACVNANICADICVDACCDVCADLSAGACVMHLRNNVHIASL